MAQTTDPMPPAAWLKRECRNALIREKGDTAKAYERINRWLLSENNAHLERELTSAYRSIAIRALIATHYNELRAEGRLPRPPGETRILTSDPTQARPPRQPTWAKQHVSKVQERVEQERQAYEDRLLETFRVNGEPIGDCTAEAVLAQADVHERDARFMRLMASGVPPRGRIRDYVSAEEAKERWQMAQEPPPAAPSMQQWLSGDWLPAFEGKYPFARWFVKGRPLRSQDEYEAARRRVAQLDQGASHRTIEGHELTILARLMSEYEQEHRGYDDP